MKTTSQSLTQHTSWKALAVHFKKIRKLHLRELFADDLKRGERLRSEAAGLFLDYSKNRVTDQTLKLLVELAKESGLRARMKAMFSGEKINVTENRAVLHVALRDANVGKRQGEIDAETTPLRNPEGYQYDLNLADVAEVWRRGSVIASWLLDLTASALAEDPGLAKFAGRVSDSGEGRWTIKAAIDEGVPVPVLTTALYERFASRGEADYQDKLLSAMRFGFGGHLEKKGVKAK